MKRLALVSLIALAPGLAAADQVFLTSGGEITGDIIERRPSALVLDVGAGRVTLPMSIVVRVVSSTTDLGLFRSRAQALAARDVSGWLDLAAWAQGHELASQAREAWEHVLAVDPGNSAAQLGLGHVRVGDRWMTVSEANRARGLVEFEGHWVTPEERQTLVADRVAYAEERQAEREADARVREAEARAREAEARASAAEAEARQGEEPVASGIPYPYLLGPSYGPLVAFPFPVRPHHHHHGSTGFVPPVRVAPPPPRRDPAPVPAPARVPGSLPLRDGKKP